MSRWVILLLQLILLCIKAGSVYLTRLNLPASATKCVYEEHHNNAVVLIDYSVSSNDHVHVTTISLKVTSPYGNTIHSKENMTRGQFVFTTTEAGKYVACFWIDGHNPGGGSSTVKYTWRTGIAPKD